jgi:hypothetical protein
MLVIIDCVIVTISAMLYGLFVLGFRYFFSTNTVAIQKVNTKKPKISTLITPNTKAALKFAAFATFLVTSAF